MGLGLGSGLGLRLVLGLLSDLQNHLHGTPSQLAIVMARELHVQTVVRSASSTVLGPHAPVVQGPK